MKRQPSKKRSLTYRPSLVTYLDIVGFRDLIDRQSPNFISRAIRILQQATAPQKLVTKQLGEEYVNFSDLVVHVIPADSQIETKHRYGAVFTEIQHLAHAQSILIQEGLLIRGAVAFGGMERTYGVLFGPALIKAYNLEQKEPHVPRIIIDSTLLRELRNNPVLRRHEYAEEMKCLRPFLRADKDGVVFVDYLTGMQTMLEREDFLGLARDHRRFIKDGLLNFRKDRHILSKYAWLKSYHNEVISERLRGELCEHLLV